MWQHYFQPENLSTVFELLADHPTARIVAGASDVLIELSRGDRPTDTLIDISRIAELRYIKMRDGVISIGPMATHNMIIASTDCVASALPLAQACLEVGAPQIRARGTIGGNVITASPANDTIAPLLALGAEITLLSADGERVMPLSEFYVGVRSSVLRPDELVREIRVPTLGERQRGIFLKLGVRRAQAISLVNVAVVLEQSGDAPDSPVTAARITLGCVAPTIVRATTAEEFLIGKPLNATTCAEASRRATEAAVPIDDLRASADYRREVVAALVFDALNLLSSGSERDGWPDRPVLLETPGVSLMGTASNTPLSFVQATVNGKPVVLSPHKTLLDALREDAGLTGAKEGCAEGECGACTVWLNGQAVMACLVPAGQAQWASVTTIEGLAAHGTMVKVNDDLALHPLQAALIVNGAVQCGYCTPGMLMAGAKLLEEIPDAGVLEIQTALSGNICRCTGYRKLITAMQEATGEIQDHEEETPS